MKTAIIYGLGSRYEAFRDWIKDEISDSVKIIGVTDKDKNGGVGYPFIDREKLQMADFDEIIVTSSKYYNEISEELQNSFCIPVNKIILMDDLIEEVYKRYFQLIRTELKLADHPEYLKRISIQHVQAAMG